MIIKVCGMRSQENIREVEQLGIDWMGFIFYPQSNRFVAHYLPTTTTRVKRVGVFVNEDLDRVVETAKCHNIDIVQLHGSESPQYCAELQALGWQTIKAFGINKAQATPFASTEKYAACADYFLFDTQSPSFGGSGKQFDWKLLTDYTGKTPFLLSGGISFGDIDSILSLNHPMMMGIDINSKFETAPALKDVEKLRLFLNKIRK